jgi:ribosome biogenesis GTPase
MITLQDLGYTSNLDTFRCEKGLDSLEVGRVITENKDRYLVMTDENVYDAEILGNLRFTAESKSDLPAVGDWVALSSYDDTKALIHAILPRNSLLERRAVGKTGEKQIIAANIDSALILMAVDRDFSINRIERYMTICHAASIKPFIVLSKIDLISDIDLNELIENVTQRIKDVPLLSISCSTNQGVDGLKNLIEYAKTYCLLGSSGVGKSTLLNKLMDEEVMTTKSISEHSDRGQHITTHRALKVLPFGGIIIDNPGMREVGIADASDGLSITFESFAELAEECKYKDCTHISESGCAVLEALDRGKLDEDSYTNYLKMLKEQAHFESTITERKRQDKEIGKLIKNFKKINYKQR